MQHPPPPKQEAWQLKREAEKRREAEAKQRQQQQRQRQQQQRESRRQSDEVAALDERHWGSDDSVSDED